MGGSASVCCAIPTSKVISTFVDETLLEGESILKLNSTTRKKFVEYIKGDEWVDSLTCFENRLNMLSASSESTWKRFGYKTPHASGTKSSRSSLQLGDSSRSPAWQLMAVISMCIFLIVIIKLAHISPKTINTK